MHILNKLKALKFNKKFNSYLKMENNAEHKIELSSHQSPSSIVKPENLGKEIENVQRPLLGKLMAFLSCLIFAAMNAIVKVRVIKFLESCPKDAVQNCWFHNWETNPR